MGTIVMITTVTVVTVVDIIVTGHQVGWGSGCFCNFEWVT